MYLGRVVGCLWSTVKQKDLEGQRLLIVQPLTPELKPTGKRLLCTDTMGAGAGELVYWCRGKESSFPFLPTEVPTDTTIVGIVDSVHVNRTARTETKSEEPPRPASSAPVASVSAPVSPISPSSQAVVAAHPAAATFLPAAARKPAVHKRGRR